MEGGVRRVAAERLVQAQLLRDLAELARSHELEVAVAPAVGTGLDALDAVHRQVVLEQRRAGRGEVRRYPAGGDRHAPAQERGGGGGGAHDARRPAPPGHPPARGGGGRTGEGRGGEEGW